MSPGVGRQRLELGLGYQVNKVLNFSVPISTWLPGLDGAILVPTIGHRLSEYSIQARRISFGPGCFLLPYRHLD